MLKSYSFARSYPSSFTRWIQL